MLAAAAAGAGWARACGLTVVVSGSKFFGRPACERGRVASGALRKWHVPGMLAGALASVLEVGEGAWQQAGTRAGMLLDAALGHVWRCAPFLRRFGGSAGHLKTRLLGGGWGVSWLFFPPSRM